MRRRWDSTVVYHSGSRRCQGFGECLRCRGEIDVKATRFPKPDVVGDIGSLAINKQQTVREVIEDRYPWFEPLSAQIEDVLTRTPRKQAQGLMDFDDLLVLWLKLLKEHEEVRELYQKRFQFVLVTSIRTPTNCRPN